MRDIEIARDVKDIKDTKDSKDMMDFRMYKKNHVHHLDQVKQNIMDTENKGYKGYIQNFRDNKYICDIKFIRGLVNQGFQGYWGYKVNQVCH